MRVINYCWFLKSSIDYNHYKCSTDFKKLNQPSCFSLIPRMTNIAVFKNIFAHKEKDNNESQKLPVCTQAYAVLEKFHLNTSRKCRLFPNKYDISCSML